MSLKKNKKVIPLAKYKEAIRSYNDEMELVEIDFRAKNAKSISLSSNALIFI